jgi:hypothetical protein
VTITPFGVTGFAAIPLLAALGHLVRDFLATRPKVQPPQIPGPYGQY